MTFLRLGDMQGGAQHRGHAGEIEVTSWSWGLEGSAAAPDRRNGHTALADLVFIKGLDSASTALMSACASGEVIPDGRFAILPVGGETGKPLMTVDLAEVQVTGYEVADESGDTIEEIVSLVFSRIEFEITAMGADGKPGQPTRFGWDVAKGGPV